MDIVFVIERNIYERTKFLRTKTSNKKTNDGLQTWIVQRNDIFQQTFLKIQKTKCVQITFFLFFNQFSLFLKIKLDVF